jgi:hypothetical protein
MASPDETHVDKPVPKRRLRSCFEAWSAAHHGTQIDDYLERCLVDYDGTYHLSSHPLPEEIAIGQGRIVYTPNPESKRHWDKLRDEAGEGGVQYLNPIVQGEILHESGQIEAEAQEVEANLRFLRDEIEQHELDRAKAISEGTKRGPRTIARLTRKRRQQALPFPWLPLFGYVAIALLILDETFQLAFPFLDVLGVDTANLSASSPIAVLGGVALAISAAAGLMFLWHVLMGNAVALTTGWEQAGPLRSGVKLVWVVILFVVLLCATFCIATLRHSAVDTASTFQDATPGQNASSPPGTGVFLFLTFLVPAGAAYIEQKIAQSSYWKLRADVQAQRAMQDEAEDQLLEPDERRADAREIWESMLALLEQQQAGLEARRKALADFVAAARDRWLHELDEAQHATELYYRTLRAALTLDRYYFLFFANLCQVMHLVPKEPVCLSPGSTSDMPTDGHGAPSRAEPASPYRVVRRLLTDGAPSDSDS